MTEMYWSIPRVTGPAIRYPQPPFRMYEERRIVADLIEALIEYGYRATDMAIEKTIATGSRPDLTLEVTNGPVLIWEVKRDRPGRACRRQARRYLDVARDVWPGRDVRVFLVYPIQRGGRRLTLEPVT